MSKKYNLFIFLFINTCCFAQYGFNSFSINDKDYFIESGFLTSYETHFNSQVYSAAVSIYDISVQNRSKNAILFSLGNTVSMNFNHFLTAPKVTLGFLLKEEYYFKTDYSLYTDFRNFQNVITPKIGYGVWGISIFYGYNIPIGKTEVPNIGHSIFGIALNLVPETSFSLL